MSHDRSFSYACLCCRSPNKAVFGDHRHTRMAYFFDRTVEYIFTINQNLPAVRFLEAKNALLPDRTVRYGNTGNADNFAGVYVNGNVIQDRDSPISGQAQVGDA